MDTQGRFNMTTECTKVGCGCSTKFEKGAYHRGDRTSVGVYWRHHEIVMQTLARLQRDNPEQSLCAADAVGRLIELGYEALSRG